MSDGTLGTHGMGRGVLTPSNQEIGQEAAAGREHGHQQGVQVQPLHQQPEEVGHGAVLEEHQAQLAANLEQENVAPLESSSWQAELPQDTTHTPACVGARDTPTQPWTAGRYVCVRGPGHAGCRGSGLAEGKQGSRQLHTAVRRAPGSRVGERAVGPGALAHWPDLPAWAPGPTVPRPHPPGCPCPSLLLCLTTLS